MSKEHDVFVNEETTENVTEERSSGNNIAIDQCTNIKENDNIRQNVTENVTEIFDEISDKRDDSGSSELVTERTGNTVLPHSHQKYDNESNMDNHVSSQPSLIDVTFFNNLNLLPRKRSRELTNDDMSVSESPFKRIQDSSSTSDQQSVSGDTQSSLVQLLHRDPKQLMELLSQALSMDSLSDLLRQEHVNSSNQLESLREKLKKTCNILTHCTDQKGSLLEQIDHVTDDIQKKRMQLQTAREELKDLSMQEGRLRAKRDEANAKCSEIRRKLFASREALQQIQKLYGKKVKLSTQKEYSTEC